MQLYRHVDPTPFVPADPVRRSERCQEIFAIQCAGLAGRLRYVRAKVMQLHAPCSCIVC